MAKIKHNRRGRPSFKPTEQERVLVESMAGLRVPQTHIARMLRPKGVDITTLRRYFAEELETGHMKADTNLRKSLYEGAVTDKVPALIIWATKQYLGMREPKTEIEHSGDIGNKTHEEALDELDGDK